MCPIIWLTLLDLISVKSQKTILKDHIVSNSSTFAWKNMDTSYSENSPFSRSKLMFIKEGESVDLRCSSEQKWHTCKWMHSETSRECLSTAEREYVKNCERYNLGRMADEKTCRLGIKNVRREDKGVYVCILDKEKSEPSEKYKVKMDVATQGELRVRTVNKYVVEKEDTQVNHIHFIEGQIIELECYSVGGNPAPTLLWRTPENEVLYGKQGRKIMASNRYLSSFTQLNYTANSSHSGATITCLGLQTKGSKVFFASKAVIYLSLQNPEHLKHKEEDRRILNGILVIGMFVVLLMSMCAVFIGRGKREKVRQAHTIWTAANQNSEGKFRIKKKSSSSFSSTALESFISVTDFEQAPSLSEIKNGNFVSFLHPDLYARREIKMDETSEEDKVPKSNCLQSNTYCAEDIKNIFNILSPSTPKCNCTCKQIFETTIHHK